MSAAQAQAIGGIHEVCFGVTDLDAGCDYWKAFGYHPIGRGRIEADAALSLYGVASGVESVRLQHLNTEHGLIRLMRWDQSLSGGIGLAPLRGHGSRWVGQFARNCLDIGNHAASAKRLGAPLIDTQPSFVDLSKYNPQHYGQSPPQPFVDRLLAVREYTLIQPFWRQAFLERFHYDSKSLGRIDDDALMRASEIVNASFMVSSDDPHVFDFYADALGLKLASVQEVPWDQAMASRAVFDLREGETHWCHTYEEPRSGTTADTRRGGRLYLFRFPSSSVLPDRMALSQPGHLGCSLFTWRVRDLQAMRDLCAQRRDTTATHPSLPDEFGVAAFGCFAPDGTRWCFQQADDSQIKELSA
jgi:catechol 2,3-dioxygenase-like lactoylglutathione lyase family enzyme